MKKYLFWIILFTAVACKSDTYACHWYQPICNVTHAVQGLLNSAQHKESQAISQKGKNIENHVVKIIKHDVKKLKQKFEKMRPFLSCVGTLGLQVIKDENHKDCSPILENSKPHASFSEISKTLGKAVRCAKSELSEMPGAVRKLTAVKSKLEGDISQLEKYTKNLAKEVAAAKALCETVRGRLAKMDERLAGEYLNKCCNRVVAVGMFGGMGPDTVSYDFKAKVYNTMKSYNIGTLPEIGSFDTACEDIYIIQKKYKPKVKLLCNLVERY